MFEPVVEVFYGQWRNILLWSYLCGFLVGCNSELPPTAAIQVPKSTLPALTAQITPKATPTLIPVTNPTLVPSSLASYPLLETPIAATREAAEASNEIMSFTGEGKFTREVAKKFLLNNVFAVIYPYNDPTTGVCAYQATGVVINGLETDSIYLITQTHGNLKEKDGLPKWLSLAYANKSSNGLGMALYQLTPSAMIVDASGITLFKSKRPLGIGIKEIGKGLPIVNNANLSTLNKNIIKAIFSFPGDLVTSKQVTMAGEPVRVMLNESGGWRIMGMEINYGSSGGPFVGYDIATNQVVVYAIIDTMAPSYIKNGKAMVSNPFIRSVNINEMMSRLE